MPPLDALTTAGAEAGLDIELGDDGHNGRQVGLILHHLAWIDQLDTAIRTQATRHVDDPINMLGLGRRAQGGGLASAPAWPRRRPGFFLRFLSLLRRNGLACRCACRRISSSSARSRSLSFLIRARRRCSRRQSSCNSATCCRSCARRRSRARQPAQRPAASRTMTGLASLCAVSDFGSELRRRGALSSYAASQGQRGKIKGNTSLRQAAVIQR